MRRAPSPKRSIQGLSMLEMVFAMVVLFLVGAFVMNMFVTGSQQMVRAGKRDKLTSLARSKAQELRLVDYATLDALPLSGTFPAPNDRFSYQITYSAFESYPLVDARTVTLVVRHPDLGRSVNRLVRSAVPVLDPGQAAFNKFACSTCHSLPPAGYAVAPDLIPLNDIGSDGDPRPFQTGTQTFNQYLVNSISDPLAFDAYTDPSSPYESLTMTDFKYQGHDADYDPDYDISNQEMTDMVNWLEGFSP